MHVKHVHIFEKGARTYVYFRKGATKIRIRREPDDGPGIKAEVERIEREIAAKSAPVTESYPDGSFGLVVDLYQASDYWTDLRPATRKSYERAIAVMGPLMRMQIGDMTRQGILQYRDEVIFPARGRWLANYAVTVIKIVLDFAIDKTPLKINPLEERVRKKRKPRDARKVNRPWTEAERTAILDAAPAHVRRILVLAMCTGMRKADLFTTTMKALKNGEIAVRTSKGNKFINIPVHPMLRETLKARPRAPTLQIATRADGLPYTADGFDTVWHRMRAKLIETKKVRPGLTIHGLRHTWGTLLIEAGIDPDHVRRLMTHANGEQTAAYTEEAAIPAETKAKVLRLNFKSKKGMKVATRKP